jgi:hypothetical protein
LTEDSPLTVAGAAAALGDVSPALRSLLIPEGNRQGEVYVSPAFEVNRLKKEQRGMCFVSNTAAPVPGRQGLVQPNAPL